MTRQKNKVVVWRPFPSPTKRDDSPLPAVPNVLNAYKEHSAINKDEAAINRWIELADILNGKKARKKSSAA